MSYIRHDAIIVTAWDSKRIAKAHAKAVELLLPVSSVVESLINGYASFLIAPDGSNEGHQISANGEEARAKWIKWARETDEKHWIDWVHVNYGGDEPENTSVKAYNNDDFWN